MHHTALLSAFLPLTLSIVTMSLSSLDRETSCIICFESFGADQKVCATVPCGHVFHSLCFAGWEQSRRGRADCKCPMCNTPTTASIRLFVNLAKEHANDDDSLSSSSTEGGNDEEEDDASNDAKLVTNQLATVVRGGPPEVIDLPDGYEGNDQQNDMPFLDKTIRKTESLSSRNPAVVRRKATRLKKRVKALEHQKRDMLEKEKIHFAQEKKFQERLKQIDIEVNELKEESKDAQRTLHHTKHELQREILLRNRAQENLALVTNRALLVEQELRDIQSKHAKQLNDAKVHSMAEVRDVLQQHRELVEENHRLKDRLGKLSNIHERENPQWSDGVDKRVDEDLEQVNLVNVKKTRDAARLWAAAKRTDMENEERLLVSLEKHTKTHVRMARKMSGQAARMSFAAMLVAKNVSNSTSTMDILQQEDNEVEWPRSDLFVSSSLPLGRKKRARDGIGAVSSKSLSEVSKPLWSKTPQRAWGSLRSSH